MVIRKIECWRKKIAMNPRMKSQLFLTVVLCFVMLLFIYQTSEINQSGNGWRHNNNSYNNGPKTFHPNAVLNYLRLKNIVDSVISKNEGKKKGLHDTNVAIGGVQ